MNADTRNTKGTWDFGNIALWAVQGLLAALFLFAGGMKLIAPAEMLTAGPVQLPVLFLRFIGFCEVLGAVGLILPAALRIREALTPMAAAGLFVIMVGATVVTIAGGDVAPAVLPLVIGLTLTAIARARWQRLQHA
jgi:hypothetical protein